MRLLYLLLFIQLISIKAYNIVGWYVNDGKTIDKLFPPEKINYSVYTHIKSNTPYPPILTS